jgi:hypothetical protein
VLVKSEARFFGDAGRIGVDGAEKFLDFLCYLLLARLTALTWLDVMLHFRLQLSLTPKTQPRHPSGSPNRTCLHEHSWGEKVLLSRETQNTQTILPGKWHFGAR